jgi:hypothetical protein
MTPATAPGAAVPRDVLRRLVFQGLSLDADNPRRTTPDRDRTWPQSRARRGIPSNWTEV